MMWDVNAVAVGIGHDIVSSDGSVIAEVFAAVDPRNNRKLARDAMKAAKNKKARVKYVLFRSPKEAKTPKFESPGVQVIRLTS